MEPLGLAAQLIVVCRSVPSSQVCADQQKVRQDEPSTVRGKR